MKTAIIGVGAFLASMVGTTAVMVMRAEPPAAAEAEAHEPADSAHAADTSETTHEVGNDVMPSPVIDAASDSFALDTTATDRDHAPESDTPPVATVDTITTGPTASQEPPVPPARTKEEREQAAVQLARIMSAMRPDDAAAVLKHMSDDEVIDVLKNFNARQAAGVLAGLSEARAAAISQRLLTRCAQCGGSN